MQTDDPHVLPSNVDDPSIGVTDDSRTAQEWTAGAALVENATEPLDQLMTERGAVVILIESAVQVLGQALASFVSNLLGH